MKTIPSLTVSIPISRLWLQNGVKKGPLPFIHIVVRISPDLGAGRRGGFHLLFGEMDPTYYFKES
jgi:hypothetical protein